jgi:hypothetical protein
MDDAGDAIAVWSRPSPANAIQRIQARLIPSTGPPGSVLTLSTGGHDGFAPRVATDADGDSTVAWVNGTAHPAAQVRARDVSATGVLGTEDVLGSTPSAGAAPSIASDADGSAITVWPAALGCCVVKVKAAQEP